MTVYDKAKFHFETCDNEGLPEEHAYMHTAVFLCWVAEKRMLALSKYDGPQDDVERIIRREGKPTDLYEDLDGVFCSDMLTAEGQNFADSYFDFEKGAYIRDYVSYLARGLKNEFHVPVTWRSYETMVPITDARYQAFKGGALHLPPKPAPAPKRPWWKFW